MYSYGVPKPERTWAVADKSVFDMEKLLDSTCDDKELVAQVAGVFLADIPVQLVDLEKALATGDAKTAERVAHSIKGASATVGGESLRDIAFDCEQLGRDGRLDELHDKLADLRARYEELSQALRDEGFVSE